MKPLIGITSGEILNLKKPWAPLTYGQCYTYSDSILRAGGIPVIIPIFEDVPVLRQLYDRLDGLLFSGGNDIGSELYHEPPHVKTHNVSTRRDNVEIELMKWALAEDLPLLAICRGCQLLNVACGGTLYQDIAAEVEGTIDHDLSYHKHDGTYLAHQLNIEPGSQLSKIISSPTIAANSHHHQALKNVAPNLVVTAFAEDGIIEAVELPSARFTIGIQCHPEELHEAEPKWQAVFDAFVESCAPNV